MASESSSSQQPQKLTPSSKVNFKCDDGIIAYNIDNTLGNSSTRRSKNYVSMPKKETVRVGLETLGLVNEDKPSLSSTTLYFSVLGSDDLQRVITQCMLTLGVEITLVVVFQKRQIRLRSPMPNLGMRLTSVFWLLWAAAL
ncbi:hypothetical protein Tco_0890698 [Tanacetum coccineum]|uniref:Uncharacterized protein n=1 Tax=Tanacetum coccineum TaxID=301880 RepID=A0ABQ5C467_9ASTR